MTKSIIKNAATASDEASTIDVLVRAFSADPVAQWLWHDPQQYHMHFPSFVRAFGGKAFTHESAYYVDGFAATALWLPPNVHPDEEKLISVVQRTVSEQIQKDFFQVFAITQVSLIGIYRLWVSTRFNREKDLARRCCNTHLSSAIATANLPILNLQIRGISPYMKDMTLGYSAKFRRALRLPYSLCYADLDETPSVPIAIHNQ
jgi:hypothetical protein